MQRQQQRTNREGVVIHTTIRPGTFSRVRAPIPLLREVSTKTDPLPTHVRTYTPCRKAPPVWFVSGSNASSVEYPICSTNLVPLGRLAGQPWLSTLSDAAIASASADVSILPDEITQACTVHVHAAMAVSHRN